MKTFYVLLALAIILGLFCGWCAMGIDPPPLNTPTPVESEVP